MRNVIQTHKVPDTVLHINPSPHFIQSYLTTGNGHINGIHMTKSGWNGWKSKRPHCDLHKSVALQWIGGLSRDSNIDNLDRLSGLLSLPPQRSPLIWHFWLDRHILGLGIFWARYLFWLKLYLLVSCRSVNTQLVPLLLIYRDNVALSLRWNNESQGRAKAIHTVSKMATFIHPPGLMHCRASEGPDR